MMVDVNFVAHIIRDVFPDQSSIISFSEDISLVEELRRSEHGLEAWGLYYGKDNYLNHTYAHSWLPNHNDSFFGLEFCDLFISIDYTPSMPSVNPYRPARSIYRLVKDGGIVFIVNSEHLTEILFPFFDLRSDLIEMAQSYSMFRDEKVLVLQKQ